MNETNLREIFGEERSVGFDQVAISVASPDAIRSWSKGEVKIRKRSITGRLSRKRAGYSANEFLVRPATGSVRAESTSGSSTRVSFVTGAAWK